MRDIKNNNVDENELKKISELLRRNYKLFIFCIFSAILLAFAYNRFAKPVYKVSASILIKEKNEQQTGGGANVTDFLNSSLFGRNINFQNELWVLKSSPVLDQTIRNLNLEVQYYEKKVFQYMDVYHQSPFRVLFLADHPQPLGVNFKLKFFSKEAFHLEAEGKNVSFYNFENEHFTHTRDKWSIVRNGVLGKLIETPDLAFVITADSSNSVPINLSASYSFVIKNINKLSNEIGPALEFKVVDRLATVIEISMVSESLQRGRDVINELMSVYSDQNLERKNHIASITIDYIEKQLDEISDSLSMTEDNLQRFRSSNQLLNITEQATGISEQYMNLQNQMAELVSRKRYYDYVADYLSKNDDFSNMIVPASLGLQDPLLSSLMAELIAAQAQRGNLIRNNQEKNPLVQKLGIQIENVKKTISDNITSVGKTTSISIEELEKRITKIETEISRLPLTQRRLGNIERKYRLNDAIYNYMLEKRAEAKITKASNLPDQVVIEPAKMVGVAPVSPNKRVNYIIALFFGFVIPLGLVTLKDSLNTRIGGQEDVTSLTNEPVLGKILHNQHKTNNVMFEYPKSNIAESFRALRTNLDFYVRGGHKKIILVTSSLEREGKSFISQNLAMSYAQLGRKTILVDFDLRKPSRLFNTRDDQNEGLSSYMINCTKLESIILKSPHPNLDYINAGVLPPNPVELIALEKTEKLLSLLKDAYDIVVLDTTPLAQVTDAYLLIEHAELKVIVVRQNYSPKKVFSVIMKDLLQKRVRNVCIVLNDNRVYNDQYGYGYGYNGKANGTGKKKLKKNGALPASGIKEEIIVKES
ncbi:MAG TPA: polysaccharide biosynthesis tyrosine autokinase [Bacteroidales bacterium]|nr:polysaccharide biosynthesis tyrosine autokinase [Bacteroidales bacterium]